MAGAMTVVRWRDDAALRDRLEARDVQPEQAFAMELLGAADGEHLIYDGETIKLNVDNGSWVWRVVEVDTANGVVYGKWPD